MAVCRRTRAWRMVEGGSRKMEKRKVIWKKIVGGGRASYSVKDFFSNAGHVVSLVEFG